MNVNSIDEVIVLILITENSKVEEEENLNYDECLFLNFYSLFLIRLKYLFAGPSLKKD